MDEGVVPSTRLVDRLTYEQKLELAIREYYHVEDAIDRFDERSLRIKSWSVTASGVAIAFSYVEGEPLLLLVGAFSAIIFWYLEATWKYFQDALGPRIEYLEKTIRENVNEYEGPGVDAAFKRHFNIWRELIRFPQIFTYRNVNLPHSIVALIGFYLYFYEKNLLPHWLTFPI